MSVSSRASILNCTNVVGVTIVVINDGQKHIRINVGA